MGQTFLIWTSHSFRALCDNAAKGTGLGLAIVGKIMDDHAGRMELGAAESGGASVKLWFKRPQSDKA